MKKLQLLFSILAMVFLISGSGCEFGNSEAHKIKIAKETIVQFIEVDGTVPFKDLEIISVTAVDDSSYKAVHTLTNTILKKEMRIERIYFLASDLKTCKKKKDLKIEMKSAGEWIGMKH